MIAENLMAHKPDFEIPENHCPGMSEKSVGQAIQGIINYEVIEKTESYTVLLIRSIILSSEEIKTKPKFIPDEYPLIKYEPEFEIPENHCPGIADRKIGQRTQGVINYEVIERTKSYTILRIRSIILLSEARKY